MSIGPIRSDNETFSALQALASFNQKDSKDKRIGTSDKEHFITTDKNVNKEQTDTRLATLFSTALSEIHHQKYSQKDLEKLRSAKKNANALYEAAWNKQGAISKWFYSLLGGFGFGFVGGHAALSKALDKEINELEKFAASKNAINQPSSSLKSSPYEFGQMYDSFTEKNTSKNFIPGELIIIKLDEHQYQCVKALHTRDGRYGSSLYYEVNGQTAAVPINHAYKISSNT